MPTLSHAQAKNVFPLLMSIQMSGIMSLCILILKQGWGPTTFSTWLHTWPLAWCIAYPCILMLVPLNHALLARLTRPAAKPTLHS